VNVLDRNPLLNEHAIVVLHLAQRRTRPRAIWLPGPRVRSAGIWAIRTSFA